MSLLALDLGEKRVGIAISTSNIIAQPLVTLKVDDNFYPRLKKICLEEKVEKLIIGLPKSLRGKNNLQERKTKRFASFIKKEVGLPMVFVDERYTTKMAEERKARDPDQEAAVIILQDYLDGKRKR